MNEVLKKIKSLRLEKGWTIADTAIKLGFASQASYQKIESGKTSITIDKLFQLAELFDVTPQFLLGLEETKGSRVNELERINEDLKSKLELTQKLNTYYETDLTISKVAILHLIGFFGTFLKLYFEYIKDSDINVDFLSVEELRIYETKIEELIHYSIEKALQQSPPHINRSDIKGGLKRMYKREEILELLGHSQVIYNDMAEGAQMLQILIDILSLKKVELNRFKDL
ncbi:helix-turn-helix transcriptional regulator [Flammeovirgaceae bacterium SG7u.111]|nr:helix-turn-helix transcriptional regulator [Flammeovirgaceae bacterium SG7u.132]WPO33918.1 helix-turn-helix transcriptional regulator [Flammeovirgaceae bacterium SG7u.111]